MFKESFHLDPSRARLKVIMQDFFLKLDYWLFDLINQKGPFGLGDQFFPWVTDLHKNFYFKLVVIPLILFFFLKTYKKAGSLLFVILLLAVGASDLSGAFVKNQVLRQRPFENPEIVATQRSPAGSKSFYSNHSSNIVAFATYTGLLIPQLKIPLILIAGCVGYSRIYNGVHYPSDVFAGVLMGIFWGYLFSLAAKKILARLVRMKETS